MAKKTATTSPKTKTPAVEVDADVSTPVKATRARNSSVPPRAKAKAVVPSATTTEVTNEMIAEHAYHMWKNGEPGDEMAHWTAAERALRGK